MKYRNHTVNNHQRLVRQAMLAIGLLQEACDDLDVGRYPVVKEKLIAALSGMGKALDKQFVRQEQVEIQLTGTGARVARKTEFVDVAIKDLTK